MRATWSARAFEFVLPWTSVTIDPSTVVAARRRVGVVLLDVPDSVGTVAVSDGLIGVDGMRVLRAVLGERFGEA